MSKRILALCCALLLASSCSKDNFDTVAGGAGSADPNTITAIMADESRDTRVDLTEDGDSGALKATWNERDYVSLFCQGVETMLSYMVTEISDDKLTATFRTSSTDYDEEIERAAYHRLLHNTRRDLRIREESLVTVSLASQVVNMGSPLTTLSKSVPMISKIVDGGLASMNVTPAWMQHMGGAIKIAMRFENLPISDLRISTVKISGVASSAEVDLKKDLGDDGFMTSSLGDISCQIVDSPVVENYDAEADNTYTMAIPVMPFLLAQGEQIGMTVTMWAGNSVYTKEFALSYSEDINFARATYTTLNKVCDMSDAALVEATSWNDIADSEFASGSGTAESPYLIATPQQLAKISKDVAGKNRYSGVYFKLSNDIDLAGLQWVAIGNYSTASFGGNFNGDGHQVKNLTINNDSKEYNGLFGSVNGAVIRNVGVGGSISSNQSWLGAVVASASSTAVISCHSSASIRFKSKNYIGGLAGMVTFRSSVYLSYNVATFSTYSNGLLPSSDSYSVGAFAGYINLSSSTAENCYSLNYGTLKSLGENKVTEGVSDSTEEYMTSQAFVEELNNKAYAYNQTADDSRKACAWVYNEGGYPTMDAGNYNPQFTEQP